MNLLPSLLMCVSLSLVVAAVCGCGKPAAPAEEYRRVQFHILNDDPTGLYVFEISDEQAAAIDEDLQIDIVGNLCRIDRAFLQSAIPTFHHRGKPIGSVADPIARQSTPWRIWVVKRAPREIIYYIGTEQQYALDRSRPHQIGNRTYTF